MRLGAIEAGGTSFVLGIGDEHGGIVERFECPTSAPGPTAAAVRGWLGARGPLDAIGIASFGPVRLCPGEPGHGTILDTPKPGWSGFSWTAALASLGVPLALDTDVNAAALAECRWGAARGARQVVYLTVGTGIGAGILVEGRPLHGILHPEAGHMRVPKDPDDDFPGVCPFHGGCLEGLAAAPAIRARAGLDPHAVPAGHPVWPVVARLLARGVHAIASSVAPEVVVLGGGVMRAEGLVAAVASGVEDLDGGYLPALPRVVSAGLGPDAGLSGALLLAAQSVPESSFSR